MTGLELVIMSAAALLFSAALLVLFSIVTTEKIPRAFKRRS